MDFYEISIVSGDPELTGGLVRMDYRRKISDPLLWVLYREVPITPTVCHLYTPEGEYMGATSTDDGDEYARQCAEIIESYYKERD